jgi:hypothetical protein
MRRSDATLEGNRLVWEQVEEHMATVLIVHSKTTRLFCAGSDSSHLGRHRIYA